MGAHRQRWMLFRQPFFMAGKQIVENTSSCRNKLISLIYIKPHKRVLGQPLRMAAHSLKRHHRGGQTEHHGDDVCGGSCVDAWQNSRTIPTVEKLRDRSFLFPPKPIDCGKAVNSSAATVASAAFITTTDVEVGDAFFAVNNDPDVAHWLDVFNYCAKTFLEGGALILPPL